ncbi:IclR family transcriptional regulator [Achromobacter aloeverae]
MNPTLAGHYGGKAKKGGIMRTIERAFAVISAFSPSTPSLTLQEIADHTDLHKATAFRIVRALERLGYLVRLPDLRYSLSLGFTRLAAVATESLDVRRLLRPVLEDLARSAGENVSLHRMRGELRQCVDIAWSKTPLIDLDKPNALRPLTMGAASIVLMAYMDEGLLADVIDDAAKAGECSIDDLQSILDTTRKQGFAVSHGAVVRSLTGIAAPIFCGDGMVDYVIAILSPTSCLAGRVTDLIAMTKFAAANASQRLGGTGGLKYAMRGLKIHEETPAMVSVRPGASGSLMANRH